MDEVGHRTFHIPRVAKVRLTIIDSGGIILLSAVDAAQTGIIPQTRRNALSLRFRALRYQNGY
jgi:hypothetical protein